MCVCVCECVRVCVCVCVCLLLKPGYPAVAHDSILAARSTGALRAVGELNVAYSVIGSKAATFASIIGVDLPRAHMLSAKQLGFSESAKLLSFSGRVAEPAATVGPGVALSRCDKADFQLYHVTEANQHGGPTLMGEVGKIVPHSPMRFSGLLYTATDATVSLPLSLARALSLCVCARARACKCALRCDR